ncbi:GNAT family N-acetyltransferase [Halalkalibacter alkalisediminis]|nr:GNAT family N-acetyltransferase [Halalkalibacter alkalisediminis]
MLTTKEQKDIRALQAICEQEDKIELKLNWDLLEARAEKEQNDFLYYEEHQLIGFLGIYGFGNKVELCGMVHPEKRKQGIFQSLLKQALEEMAKRKYETVLLNIPASSESGRRFVKHQPFEMAFSEYQMVWEKKELTANLDHVGLRHATKEELPFFIQLDAECFKMSRKEAASMYENVTDIDGNLIIEAKGEPVGKLRWHQEGNESWIYGFAIKPEYQGQGIGRTALIQAVQQEAEKGKDIYLEVVPENEHALKLYQSCGFRSFSTQDYYQLVAARVK